MKLLSLTHCCAFVNEFFYRLCIAHGRPQDFFQIWANYGSGDDSLPVGFRDGAPMGSQVSLLEANDSL